MKLPVEFLDGEPVNVIFPEFVDLEVISTPPSLSSRFCQTCAFDKGCRHPAESCPAMEACGIDVFATARKHGFTIKVVKTYKEPQHHFGLILIE